MEYTKWIIIILIALYFIIGLLYYLFQNRFIFVRYDIKGKYSLNLEQNHTELLLKAKDGETMHALWIKAENPKGLIIYFHGNTGSLKRWGKVAAELTSFGYDILATEYRGYGKSTGNPSEKRIIADAELFYDFALEHYPENQVVIYGRSLGSSVAIQISAKHNPRCLILETPFYNLMNVAWNQIPIYPYHLMLRHKFKSNYFIKYVKSPILFMHGTNDRQVRYKSARRLYNLVADRKNVSFHTFKEGGHNNLSTYDKYDRVLEEILS